MAKLGITEFAGGQGQAPWGFLTSQFPQYALGYSALGYVGANPLQLGSSPELPSLNFEVAGPISGAVQETCTVASGAGYAFTPAYFNLTASVTEQVTILATAPYQIQAQNPTAQTHILVAGGGAIIGAIFPAVLAKASSMRMAAFLRAWRARPPAVNMSSRKTPSAGSMALPLSMPASPSPSSI